jgi:hypothetical protein
MSAKPWHKDHRMPRHSVRQGYPILVLVETADRQMEVSAHAEVEPHPENGYIWARVDVPGSKSELFPPTKWRPIA